MFELKPMTRQLLLACGSLAGALVIAETATAQQTPQPAAQQPQKLERIEITGSNIRRTDTATVAPVQIITREEIARSGQQTVGDVLSRLPANTGGNFNETANSFAPGTQSVSLRGLGQKATLVLINGRRVSSFGFAQNIQDSFVDLSQIPLDAVERIEILKDGASAIYGSDAIAGVVNVILRRDYKGITALAGAGSFEGKNDYRAGLTFGFGDLGADKFNVLATLEYYHRDEIKMSDTKFGENRDFRGREDGGRNYTSLTTGGTWRSLTDRNAFRANADCASPLTYSQAVSQGFFNGNGPLPATWNQPGNTFCTRDFANIFTVLPETDRIATLIRGTWQQSSALELYGEAGYSQTKANYTFQEPFFAGTSGLYPSGGQLASFAYNAWFQPGVSGNPLSSPAEYSGVLNDLGTRDQKNTADAIRLLVGGKYSIAGWDLDSGIGWSQSEVEQTGRVTTKAGMSAALGIPTGPQFFPPQAGQFPFATNPPYNVNRPSLNSQALRNSIMADSVRKSTSELFFVDTKAATQVGSLPGGPIGIALGVEYRSESIKDRPSDLASSGGILGQGTVAVDGSRDSTAIYAEAALPLTKSLEASLALRNDNYSDFGNALSPKVGMKFKASPALLFRANWGRGFKAPSLPEIAPSKAYFFTTITEPTTGLASNITGSIEGNPNLEAEESRSATIGFVYEPTTDLSFDFNYYSIKWTNQVVFPDFQAIADNPTDPRKVLSPPGTPNAGQILSISAGYINASEVKTSGLDLDARWQARTLYGRFVTRGSASYIGEYKFDGIGLAGSNLAGNYINAIALPRWRAALAVDWDQGAWALTPSVNFIDTYERAFGSATLYNPPPATQQIQSGRMSRKAPSYTTYDLVGRYNFTPRLQLGFGVLNITDETPPYEPGVSTTYFFDRTVYSIIGRQYRLNVRYTME
jgi:iron complex outermembrane receptor protein